MTTTADDIPIVTISEEPDGYWWAHCSKCGWKDGPHSIRNEAVREKFRHEIEEELL